MLKVKYHRQKNEYYCGPACLQMIFEYYKKRKSQELLAKEAKTNSKIGTSHNNMIKTILKNGFYCYVNNNSTINEVKNFIDMKIPVIVNYIEPSNNEVHYAVVTSYKKDQIILNDPWNGENLKLKEKFFTSRWLDYHKHHVYKQGIIVISQKKFITGKQYIPRGKK